MLTNPATARIVGLLLLGFVALYVVGSLLHLPPLVIRKAKLEYPRPAVMVRQLIAAPLELLGAAGIIYFVLPAHLEPSFIVVLAVFLASFSAALVSHAPAASACSSSSSSPPCPTSRRRTCWRRSSSSASSIS